MFQANDVSEAQHTNLSQTVAWEVYEIGWMRKVLQLREGHVPLSSAEQKQQIPAVPRT